ncbi:hypothetical protein GQ44DRAFT_699334 [Phaeosphaeriaceae sp. PMI808]|nr:hypothetical protein GQ44DRAFT_699334 [Phaeosphaeriaceae sp. PMI808]
MSTPLSEFPTELLLTIFESSTLSLFDLLRISKTCQRWQKIVQSSTSLKYRLWLPSERLLKGSRISSKKPPQLAVQISIRHLPATIWNDYQENLWEMTWRKDKSYEAISYSWNPIVSDLENFFQLVSPFFVRQQPYTGCNIQASVETQPSLIFRSVEDLREKTRPRETGFEASWHNMLISQQIVRELGINFYVGARLGARNWVCGVPHEHVCIVMNGELKMKDFICSLRKILACSWRMINENDSRMVPTLS